MDICKRLMFGKEWANGLIFYVNHRKNKKARILRAFFNGYLLLPEQRLFS